MIQSRAYLLGLALIVIVSVMTSVPTTELMLPAASLGYGLLIFATVSSFSWPLSMELMCWLDTKTVPPRKHRHTRPSRRWLILGFLLLSVWASVAAEQLVTELATKPNSQPIELMRVKCTVSGSGKISSSSLNDTTRNGDWCFVLTGRSIPESGILLFSKIAPNTFSPAPEIGTTVNAQMVSYDSAAFGRNAYAKVMAQPQVAR